MGRAMFDCRTASRRRVAVAERRYRWTTGKSLNEVWVQFSGRRGLSARAPGGTSFQQNGGASGSTSPSAGALRRRWREWPPAASTARTKKPVVAAAGPQHWPRSERSGDRRAGSSQETVGNAFQARVTDEAVEAVVRTSVGVSGAALLRLSCGRSQCSTESAKRRYAQAPVAADPQVALVGRERPRTGLALGVRA